jgi:hypothetical protein
LRLSESEDDHRPGIGAHSASAFSGGMPIDAGEHEVNALIEATFALES